MSHARSQAVGHAVELESTPEGLTAKFKVARGPEGDRALSMAEDLVYDGLSIGLGEGKFQARDGVQHSMGHLLEEVSLTPFPAFSDARVSAVAAEQTDKDVQITMTETPAIDTSAITAAIATGFEQLKASEREVIRPGAIGVEVKEEAPYRFDRAGNLQPGKFDFSTDLINGLKNRDGEAYARATTFVKENLTFDVDRADATAVNPNTNRPDLYVDQRNYAYPLLEATRRGTLADSTPFVLPKYNTSSGLVATHTEGVEPTPGTFTVTSQTVTPAALSGKVEITRELWDQGGNPQVSNLIWQKMEQGYYEAAEARIVATLTAAAASITDIALTTAGADSALSGEIASAFASLQYQRGGFSFDTLAVQIDLYKALVAAKDGSNRPLFPIYNPMNAPGTSSSRYARMNVHGVDAFPAWSLAASGAVSANSWLFDSTSVATWISAPERLEFEYRVAYVDLAIWGYQVAAVLDTSGVRQITYDPTA